MGAITRAAANNFTTGGVIQPAAINDASVASLTELENVETGGAMTLISEQTASASASIEFTTGIDSTYPIYCFQFINIHPATDVVSFQFNMSTDGGSNYNVTKTSSNFIAYHDEADTSTTLQYETSNDLAQSTSDQILAAFVGADNDQNVSGYLNLFNPSSTTYIKHFMSTTACSTSGDFIRKEFIAGYANTTSAVNAIKFQTSSGNIDAGTIKMYGISGS